MININKGKNLKNLEYWVYILDNYQRDLPALSWWIYKNKFNHNKKICLLPKEQAISNFFITERPNVIVWNYARPNNINAIKVAKSLDIYNIIHDTEGIPYEIDQYFNNIKIKEFKYIDERRDFKLVK